MGDYGGVSSGGGAAPAELHLKMSKKIAQLTKVIFHLNTRNEDFQMEFAHLKQVHSIELQQLTHDAAAKLKLMTEQLQNQRDLATQADAKAARDKQQFMKDLALFQQQAATQHSTTQQEFQRRVHMLEEQVDQSRRAFIDRIQQLTQMAESQQRAHQSDSQATTAAMQSAHRAEIDELKRKHTEEVEQVVMSSNARYTQMLAEQLRVQDALKQELASERLTWQQSSSQELQLLQTQLKQQRDDAQRRFDEMKQQLVSKMEHLLTDAESLRTSDSTLRTEKEEMLKTQGDLQRQVKMLELQVSKSQQDTLSVRKDADANAQKLQQLLALSTERIAQLTQELESLKKALIQRDADLDKATKERDALQLEMLKGSASLSERQVQYQQQLNERDLKLANLQAELSQQRQQSAMNESESVKKMQSLEARLADKSREAADLQQKLASADLMRATLHKDKEQVLNEFKAKLTEAEKTVATLRSEHALAIQALKIGHQEMTASMKATHTTELEKLKRESDKRVADLEAQLKQDSSASMDKAMSELKQRHGEAIAQLKGTIESKQAEWEREKTQLQTQLQQLQTQLSQKTKEATDALAKVVELSAKLKNLEDQVASLLKEKDALAKSSQKSQKDRDEAFQKQMKEMAAQHDSAIKRLTSEKDRLVLDHKQVVIQLTQDHTDKLTKAQAEWELNQRSQLENQNATLVAFYDRQLKELQQQLESERESAEAAARAAELEYAKLEGMRTTDIESLRAEKAEQALQVAEKLAAIELAHRESVERIQRTHAEEIDRLTAKFKAEKDELNRASVNQLEYKRQQMTTQHQSELESLRQQHAVAMKTLQDTSQSQRNTETLALRAEMAQKLKDLRSQKDQEQTRALAEMKATHDAAYHTLETNAESLQSSLATRTKELESARLECVRLHASLEAKSQELHDRVAALEKLNRDEVEKLKLAAKRDMDRLLEENLAETKQLSDQFEETRRLMLDKVAFLKSTVADWEDKYARRESRPEDVARIASLERSVAEKEALVKQTLDEMAYFKRELLNREEMYNKTFARTPNVGVLNVLKPHVQLQAQLQSQNQNQTVNPIPMPPTTPQTAKRKTKPGMNPAVPEGAELQRRGSERGTTGTTKKSLPPLLASNNQGLGL